MYLSFIEDEVAKLQERIDELNSIEDKVDRAVSDIKYDLESAIRRMSEEAAATILDELDIEDDVYGEFNNELAEAIQEGFDL